MKCFLLATYFRWLTSIVQSDFQYVQSLLLRAAAGGRLENMCWRLSKLQTFRLMPIEIDPVRAQTVLRALSVPTWESVQCFHFKCYMWFVLAKLLKSDEPWWCVGQYLRIYGQIFNEGERLDVLLNLFFHRVIDYFFVEKPYWMKWVDTENVPSRLKCVFK